MRLLASLLTSCAGLYWTTGREVPTTTVSEEPATWLGID